MLHKFFAYTLLALSLGLSVWVFYHFKFQSGQPGDPLKSLPSNIECVVRFIPDYSSSIGENAQVLKKLIGNYDEDLIQIVSHLDSARLTSSNVRQVMDKSDLLIGLFGDSNWVICSGIALPAATESLSEVLDKLNVGVKNQSKNLLGFSHAQVTNSPVHIFWNNELLVLTDYVDLIAENSKAAGQGTLPFEQTDFLHSYKKLGRAPLNALFNDPGNHGQWVGFDIYPDENHWNIYGFQSPDPGTHNDFTESIAVQELVHWMPYDTDSIQLEIAGVEQFMANFKKRQNQNGTLGAYHALLSAVETECECDAEKDFANHIGNHAHIWMGDDEFIWLDLNQEIDFSERQLVSEDSLDHRGAVIKHFNSTAWLNALFEVEWKGAYFIKLGDVMVLGASAEALKYYSNYLISGRTAQQSAMGRMMISSLAIRPGTSKISMRPGIHPLPVTSSRFNAFEVSALVWQDYNFPDGDKMLFSQMHFNPAKTDTDGIESGCLLDHNLYLEPQLVTNHYTHEREVAVQDDGGVFYLISPNGNLIWKRQLSGLMRSKVSQVDLFRNGKLQMIFSTDSVIYCLDRNGKDVEGFPVKLPSKASAPLAVFDYDNTKDYRFIIGCEDGQIYNYNGSGKRTGGWSFDGAEGAVINVEHLRFGDRDFILALERNGQIHLLRRTGKVRESTQAKAINYSGQGFALGLQDKIGDSFMLYPDTAGNIVSIPLVNKSDQPDVVGLTRGSYITSADIDNDNRLDYIVAEGSQIIAYNSDWRRIFGQTLDSRIIFAPKTYRFSSHDQRIGVVTESGQAYLINEQGELSEGFPVPGNTAFSISDLDKDGGFEVIVGKTFGELSISDMPGESAD